jgi:hypothetical protein
VVAGVDVELLKLLVQLSYSSHTAKVFGRIRVGKVILLRRSLPRASTLLDAVVASDVINKLLTV